uniref:Uncharacterized protein n=1 Tax=Anguilla anguilla TaxID=7936 RepID=A0A0E9TYI4_ANGAN
MSKTSVGAAFCRHTSCRRHLGLASTAPPEPASCFFNSEFSVSNS